MRTTDHIPRYARGPQTTDLVIGCASQSRVIADQWGDPRTGAYWDVIASVYCGMTWKARQEALILGLGLGTIPRIIRWAERRTPMEFTAVELDPRCVEMAREHDYDTEVGGQIVVDSADAFLVKHLDRRWDLVVEDTWVGAQKPQWLLGGIESAMNVTSRQGFFVMNMLHKDHGRFVPRISARFKHVVTARTESLNKNLYAIATDRDTGFDHEIFKRNAARLLRPETLGALSARTVK